MRRREATRLFREICECIPDAFISSVMLTSNSTSKEELSLRINVNLNRQSLKKIRSIVDKHGMNLKEDNGFLMIFGFKKYLNGMEIIA